MCYNLPISFVSATDRQNMANILDFSLIILYIDMLPSPVKYDQVDEGTTTRGYYDNVFTILRPVVAQRHEV